MDWITTANGLISLLIGLGGLITTAITAWIAIKSFIKSSKEKGLKENWKTIQNIADAAMKEIEAQAQSGKLVADKKGAAIEIVKTGAKAAGINIDLFLDQLSSYIDETINFVNTWPTNN